MVSTKNRIANYCRRYLYKSKWRWKNKKFYNWISKLPLFKIIFNRDLMISNNESLPDDHILNTVVYILQLFDVYKSSQDLGYGYLAHLWINIENSNLGLEYIYNYGSNWLFQDGQTSNPYFYKGFIIFVVDHKKQLLYTFVYSTTGGIPAGALIAGAYIYVLPCLFIWD